MCVKNMFFVEGTPLVPRSLAIAPLEASFFGERGVGGRKKGVRWVWGGCEAHKKKIEMRNEPMVKKKKTGREAKKNNQG